MPDNRRINLLTKYFSDKGTTITKGQAQELIAKLAEEMHLNNGDITADFLQDLITLESSVNPPVAKLAEVYFKTNDERHYPMAPELRRKVEGRDERLKKAFRERGVS